MARQIQIFTTEQQGELEAKGAVITDGGRSAMFLKNERSYTAWIAPDGFEYSESFNDNAPVREVAHFSSLLAVL